MMNDNTVLTGPTKELRRLEGESYLSKEPVITYIVSVGRMVMDSIVLVKSSC